MARSGCTSTPISRSSATWRGRAATKSIDARARDAAAGGLTVDLDALVANHDFLLSRSGGAEVAPVVKADAYGLGAGPVAARLHGRGARSFFVARVVEGERLRAALGARSADVYVLDGCAPGNAQRLLSSGLTPVLNSPPQVAEFAREAPPGAAAGLHIDTGLNRLGLSLAEAHELAGAPGDLARLRLALVMSHMAFASTTDHPANVLQLERFARAAGAFPGARKSLANSAGLMLGPRYAFDMVRPGVALYGGGPGGDYDARLAAVATLEAPILQVRQVPAGETVGYGGAFVTARPTRLAIVGAGYADGVLRASSPGGYGLVDGRRLPLVGRVSMDLIAMDATEIPGAVPGALVQLVGAGVPLDGVARSAGTIAYEILVRLGRGASRNYVGAPA